MHRFLPTPTRLCCFRQLVFLQIDQCNHSMITLSFRGHVSDPVVTAFFREVEVFFLGETCPYKAYHGAVFLLPNDRQGTRMCVAFSGARAEGTIFIWREVVAKCLQCMRVMCRQLWDCLLRRHLLPCLCCCPCSTFSSLFFWLVQSALSVISVMKTRLLL